MSAQFKLLRGMRHFVLQFFFVSDFRPNVYGEKNATHDLNRISSKSEYDWRFDSDFRAETEKELQKFSWA